MIDKLLDCGCRTTHEPHAGPPTNRQRYCERAHTKNRFRFVFICSFVRIYFSVVVHARFGWFCARGRALTTNVIIIPEITISSDDFVIACSVFLCSRLFCYSPCFIQPQSSYENDRRKRIKHCRKTARATRVKRQTTKTVAAAAAVASTEGQRLQTGWNAQYM